MFQLLPHEQFTSSLSDMHGAITGAIASLKGPLHGGANEAVMYMFKEIGKPKKAKAWIEEAIEKKKVIMGLVIECIEVVTQEYQLCKAICTK